MSKVWKLAIAFLKGPPARVVLTSLATTAATCMVVWMSAGYDALLQSFDVWANVALGHYELSIAPIDTAEKRLVPNDIVEMLRKAPEIASVEPMWIKRAKVTGKVNQDDLHTDASSQPHQRSSWPPNLFSEYSILSTSSMVAPFEVDGRWFEGTNEASPTAVVRADIAEQLHVGKGDHITVTIEDQKHELEVVGLLKAPTLETGEYTVPNMMTSSAGHVFVSTKTGENIFEQPAETTFVGIAMKPDADINAFRFGLAPKLSEYSPPVQFQEAYEIEEALDESAAADNVRLQAYAATGISFLVALLVIFCTINMGVTERVRQFAMLRAVVLTRSQICLLIFAKCFLLALIGYVVGLTISWVMLASVAQIFSGLLHHGAVIGFHSLALSALATLGGALLAAAVPAWRATRVKPVDAMSPSHVQLVSMGIPVPWICTGFVLIAINPILTFLFPPDSETKVIPYLGIGFVTMAIGFVLISPLIVSLVDRLCAPLLAKLLGIDPKLLASQITSHVWRTAAASISLAVGIGLFIAVQVWGFTMLDGFIVGPWAPDAVVAFGSDGLPVDQFEKFKNIPGVDVEQALPIVVEQPRLLNDITGSAERASVTRQDNVVIVGIDPIKGFGADNPLFEVEWVQGSPAEAAKLMTEERSCIVPDHFLTETGLKLGDSFELVPPKGEMSSPVSYKIAAAIKLPGWHWQTKLTGFRSRTHRAAALVFANYEYVANDFQLPTATHAWFDFRDSKVDPEAVLAAAMIIKNQSMGVERQSVNEAGMRIVAVEQIRNMTRQNAARWIWAISQLPIIATLIAAFGVLNVILASIRSRQWELGILRSIGFTRSSIVLAILGEGILIGVVAALISLGFGVMAGWCGCGMAQYMSFFGGLHPALHIPWAAIAVVLTFVVVLSTLTSVWPVVSIGRLRPLTLLQRGRASF